MPPSSSACHLNPTRLFIRLPPLPCSPQQPLPFTVALPDSRGARHPRGDAIGDADTECADVISHHAVCCVCAPLVCCPNAARVRGCPATLEAGDETRLLALPLMLVKNPGASLDLALLSASNPSVGAFASTSRDLSNPSTFLHFLCYQPKPHLVFSEL